jgi:hypothetical protein
MPKSRPVSPTGRGNTPGNAEIAPGQPHRAPEYAREPTKPYDANDGDSNSRHNSTSFGDGSASVQLSALIALS